MDLAGIVFVWERCRSVLFYDLEPIYDAHDSIGRDANGHHSVGNEPPGLSTRAAWIAITHATHDWPGRSEEWPFCFDHLERNERWNQYHGWHD
jgi:hypothetical protein